MNRNNLGRGPTLLPTDTPPVRESRDALPHPVLASGVFFGRPTVERRVGATVLSLRQADPYRIIERHSHEDAHFVFVLDGRYVSSARGMPLSPTRPLLVYNPPGTTHRDHFAGNRGVHSGAFFTLSVAPTHGSNTWERTLGEDHARALLHPAAIGLAHALVRECETWDDVSGLAVEEISQALQEHAEAVPNTVDRSPPTWLYRVVDQLYASDISHPPSLQELSAEADIHPVYLARAFKHFMGCTPAELLRRRRLQKALAYIRGTLRPLSEIAATCGFADQSHMTRATRAAVGCSPTTYRVRGGR